MADNYAQMRQDATVAQNDPQSPDDAAASRQANVQSLRDEILRTRDPRARAVLQQYLNYANGGDPPSNAPARNMGDGFPELRGAPSVPNAPTPGPAPQDNSPPQQAPQTINSMQDLRAWYGDHGKGMSDEAMMTGFARVTGANPVDLANHFGYDPGSGSRSGERLSSSIDNYQAGLYRVAGAGARALGLKGAAAWADSGRDDNEFQANVADARASNLGAINRFSDVHSASDLGNYAAGLGISALPTVAEIAATGMTGGLAAPAVLGLRGAQTLEGIAAATSAAKWGGRAAAFAGDLPTQTGAILRTQQEQNGSENLGAAVAGAVPMSALNLLGGVGEAAVSRSLPKNMIGALDNVNGLKGVAARGLATAGIEGAEQGAIGLGQAGVEQVAGRMAVDPNETFLNDKSEERFKEAGIGGTVMGLGLGGATGWRRGHPAELPKPTVDDQGDLLDRGSQKPLMLGYDPSVGSAIDAHSDQTPMPVTAEGQAIAAGTAEAHGDYQLQQRAPGGLQTPAPATTYGDYALQDHLPAAPPPPPGTPPIDPHYVGFGHEQPGETGHNPYADNSFASLVDQSGGAAIRPDPFPNGTQEPQTAPVMPVGGPGSQVGATPEQAAAMREPGTLYAMAQQAKAAEERQAQQAAIDKSAQEAAVRQKAAEDAIGGPRKPDGTLVKKIPQRVVDTFHALVAARDAGVVTPTDFAEQAGYLKAGVPGDVQKVKKFIQEKVGGQSDVSKVAPVAQSASAGRSDQPAGSSGAVGPVAPDAARPVGGAAPAPAVSGDAAPTVGLAAAAGVPAPVAPVAKFQKAPRPDAKPVIKPRDPVAPSKEPGLPKYDNIPDLAEAVAKENGLTEKHVQAYVDSTVMGRSMSKIAADLGVGKSTVGDMVTRMKELVEPQKRMRLEASEDATPHVNDELAQHIEQVADHPTDEADVAPEHSDETADLSGEHGSRSGDEAIKVDDEGVVDVAGDAKQTGVSVRDSMDAGGETKAKTDDKAASDYKKKLGDKNTQDALGEHWAQFNKELPKRDQVKWDDLTPGQKLWFGEEMAKGNGKEGHQNVTSIANDPDMRLTDRLSHDSFAVRGSDGKIAGNDSPSSMGAMRSQLGKVEARFPQLASKEAGAKLGFRYGPPSPVGKAILASAMDNVDRSAAGPFFKAANSLVKHVVDLKQAPGDGIGAAYLPGSGMIAVHLDHLPEVGAHEPNTIAVQHIIHEYVHAADDLVGRSDGAGHELSLGDNSPTRARVEYKFGPDGSVTGELHLGPVIKEALDAYRADPAKWDDLAQAAHYLSKVEKMMEVRKGNLDKVDLEALEDVLDTASVELTPKLMEMALAAPDTLAELPLGKAHAEALAAADSPAAIAKVLGGIDDGKPSTDGRPGEGVSAVQPVPRQVQAGAATGARPVASEVRGADRRVAESGEAASGFNHYPSRLENSGVVDTPAFKKWFGDSKVVDADGEPLVMYHGSSKDMSEILSAGERNQLAGEQIRGDGTAFGNRGAYFTADPMYAGTYAGTKGAVYPVYLSLQNPKIIPKLDHTGKATSLFQRVADALGAGDVQARRDASMKQRQESMYITPEMLADYRKQGYDGIINHDAHEVVVFDPTQVKSAVGNDGSFNPKDRDIRRSELTPPPLTEKGGLLKWAKGIVSDKLYRNHPGVLGWLSTEQLASAFPEHKSADGYSKTMQRMGGASTHMMAASDMVSRAWSRAKSGLGELERAKFDSLLNDSTRSQIWPNKPLDHADQAHLDITDPKVMGEHAKLAAQWEKTPAAYKAIFNQVQADHAARFQRYIDAQRSMIAQAFYPSTGDGGPTRALIDQAAGLKKSEREAFMDEHATSKASSDVYRSLFEGLDAQEKVSRLVGPYAPQARFGDHVVSYKAPEYLRAERDVEAANAELQRMHQADNYKPIGDLDAEIAASERKLARTKDSDRRAAIMADLAEAKAERAKLTEPMDAAKQLLADRTEKLNALKSSPDAYSVEFFENRGEAQTREKQLSEFFGNDGTEVKRTLRDQYLTSTDGITPAYIKRIEEHLTGSLQGADAAEVRKTVREMYLQNLPGTSALKNQLKRRNVPGIKDSDAQRSFANKAMRDAYTISRMEHAPQLQDHLAELRNSDNEDSKIVGNELAKRLAQNFTLKSNKWISMATNATYMTQLGLSPSFMLMQGTQQWVITAPIMAARHGMGSLEHLRQGTADAAKLLKVSFNSSRDKMSFGVDIPAAIKAGIINDREGAMLRDMFDRGRIDVTSSHDLGIAASGNDGSPLSRAAQMANWPVQQLETINRISTALAGFRAEKNAQVKGGKEVHEAEARATAYADKLVSETHMNYNSTNRARFMHPNNWGGWGRVMYQFRAYQQGMAWLVGKNLIDGMRGDKESLKAAGFLMGTMLGTAGVSGLPIPGAMAVAAHLLYKSMGQPDEDRDLKEMFFQGMKSVGGETFARAVTKGVPAALGVDLANRLGASGTFDLAPFVQDGKDGRDMVAAYWMATTMGPVGGQVANYAEAIKAASNGDFVKASTLVLPKSVADIIRAGSQQVQGTKDSRGNTILSPDEISTGASVLRALGVQSEDLSRVADQRGAFMGAKKARDDFRAKLLNDYANGTIRGNDVSDIREKMVEFNSRNPDDRIPMGSLMAVVQKRREAERAMRNGVNVSKRDQSLAASLGVE